MRRRAMMALLAAGAAGWPLGVAAQAREPYRVGYLTAGSGSTSRYFLEAFRDGMRELGYVDFELVERFADGAFDRLPALAQELVALAPDVLLVATTPANLAAKAATTRVPIVMVAVADPVGVGLVSSLSEPGGNLTGVTNIAAELGGKRLELLREMTSGLRQVAILFNPSDANAGVQMRNAEEAARLLSLRLHPRLEIRGIEDLRPAFAAALAAGAQAALRFVDPAYLALRADTIALAAEHRMPVIYAFREDAEAGGLAAYGPNQLAGYRQAAGFVHKILQGAKPGDLPIEQPTKLELLINLRTARMLGLDLPASLIARADEVIE